MFGVIVVAGSEKRTVSVVADERKRSASYEAGRCVVSWFLENCPPPLKTSILPRSTSALGYTRFAPVPEHLQTREMILDALCALVGGRAAEVVLYGDQSSLGERHLKQATKTAERFIQEFGMGDSIGNLAFDPVGKDGKRFYSNGLRQRVDKVFFFLYTAFLGDKELSLSGFPFLICIWVYLLFPLLDNVHCMPFVLCFCEWSLVCVLVYLDQYAAVCLYSYISTGDFPTATDFQQASRQASDGQQGSA